MANDLENVIIVGSGPAGYTAALYTARANLRPLVIEGFAWGGLLQQTTEVENYPGYRDGVMGPEMMQELRDQAERFGTRFVTDDATRVELSDGGLHTVWVGDEARRAKAVVLAMGAQHKKLDVPGEELLSGRGVSYCATCDAAFFKEHDTVIVGGGDSAMEEAIFLAKFAANVTVVHRRDEFRASPIMLDAVGHLPQSELVRGQVDLDENGYVKTAGHSTRTNVAGVFAAGDLVDHTYRQAVTAAGSGCKAALDAEWYLRDTPPDVEARPASEAVEA
jgi:thioredoxin reductase (NADPH)